MLCTNRRTLSRFVGTPCEGEDGIREESRDPYTLRRVPPPFRKRRRGREERPAPREETLRAHLGMPSMGVETPTEKGTMRTKGKEGWRGPYAARSVNQRVTSGHVMSGASLPTRRSI
jgi:hypothetical protein